jgi:CubicO group peptidase (beta-lactamase class C family)
MVIAFATGCSSTPAPSPATEFETWVDSVAAETLRDGLVPSVSIAVARGQNFVLEKTYGRADIENDVPAGNDTIYRIASITKQFTAAAIMRLVEQGRVDLDAEVIKYLPEFRAHGARITIRQLLNHTSGIQNITDLPALEPKMRLDLTDAQTLAIFQDEPRNFEPGTNFLYNNSGFYILAMVIERISGQSIAEYMQRSMFEPLGLRSTSVCDERRVVPRRAHGYIVQKGQLWNPPYISHDLPKGGGNMCSTAHDLVLWAQALAGGKVVSPESYKVMTTPGRLADGRPIGYGLGLFLSEFAGQEEVSHGGDFWSFTAFLAWYPADSVAIAVLQNSGAAPAFDGFLARRIVHRLLERPNAAPFPNKGDDREFERVAGTYRIGAASIDVRRDSADIVVTGDTVWQLSEHRFRPRGDGVFTSLRNPEFSLRFGLARRSLRGGGGEGAHARTLSLTLHDRAFGDAIYQEKPGR